MYDVNYDDMLLEESRKYIKEQSVERRKRRIHRFLNFEIRYIFNALKNRFCMRKFTLNGNSFGIRRENLLNLDGLRLCVYTCVVGNYDTIKEPFVCEKNIDYVIFTDQEISDKSIWRKIDITKMPEYKMYGPFKFNRMIKMLPHKFLPEYDYSMYIDGAVIPVAYMEPLFCAMGNCSFGAHVHDICDCVYDEAKWAIINKVADKEKIKKQVEEYKKIGMPKHYGVVQGNVLIRKHSDVVLQNVMQMWWEEYQRFPTRDQISLPVAMWKNGFNKNKFVSLGVGYIDNPRFKREPHRGDPVFRSDV